MFTKYFDTMELIWEHPEGKTMLKRLMKEESTIGPGAAIFSLTFITMYCLTVVPSAVGNLKIFGNLTFVWERVLTIVELVVFFAALFATLVTVSLFVQYLNCTLPNVLRELRSKELILADHGDSIGEIIVRLRNQPVEYDVAFDSEGHKLGEWTYLDPKCCAMPLETNIADGVSIHNHPNVWCMAFSPLDFGSAVIRGVHKSIVVTRDTVYTLEGFDIVMERIYPERIQIEAQRTLDGLYATIGALYPRNSRRYHLAMRNAWCGACQAIAARYGLKFTAERLQDSGYVKAYRDSLRAKSRASITDHTVKEKV